MRKNLFLILLGLILGNLSFIYLESFNIFLFLLFLILGFFFIKNDLAYIFIALSLGFSLSSLSFSSYKLEKFDTLDLDLTIIDKDTRKGYNNYTVKAYNKEYDIDEKSIFTEDKNFEIGDRLRTKAKISYPKKNTNPYLFNYRSYLLTKKIKSSLKLIDYEKIGKSNSFLLKAKKNFKDYINKVFDKNLSQNSSKFVKAVILSENYENDGLKSLGLSHILSISGLHIDLIIGFILIILINIGLSYKYSYPLSLGLCLFYGYLIGFPFSVIRVLIFHFLSFLAFILKKGRDEKKNIMVSLILILIINPFAILSQGLILSFLAGFAIYVIYPKFRKDNSYIKNKLKFIGTIQLVMFPALAHFYGSFNLLSIFANFIIVPVFEISIYLMFSISLTYFFLGKFLRPVFLILDFLIKSITYMANFLASFDIFTINFAKESILISIYLIVLLFIFLNMKKTKLLRHFLILSSFIVIFSIVKTKTRPITFSMLDIGQGDCFILEDGKDIYLFDAGEISFKDYSSSKKVLIPYLKARGVKTISGVFISHEDKDHSGGLSKLSKEFEIKNVYTNKPSKDLFKNYNTKVLKDNDRLIKNDIVIDILKNFDGEKNDQSMPVLISINNFKILTMGDLPKDKEDLVAKKAHILKISHHGSKNSTSKCLVKKVDPKIALISSGKNNPHGHPHREVLENLKDVKIYNSKDDGFVEIKFYKNKIRVKKFVKEGFFRWIINPLWKIS